MSRGFPISARRVLVSGVLLALVLGVLAAYLLVVIDLPGRVYTPAQLRYLSYNKSRSVVQSAPSWSVLRPAGAVAPASVSWRESRVEATLAARYQAQAGVTATVYDLDFDGDYRLAHTGSPPTSTVSLLFPFPANLETIYDVRFLVDGVEPTGVRYSTQGIAWTGELAAGKERRVEIHYRADGATSFAYAVSRDRRSDLHVVINVQGLAGSTVAQSSLPATAREAVAGGETFSWHYAGLIPNRDVRLDLPARLNFAQRVASLHNDFRVLALAAPLLVALFLIVLGASLHLGGVHLPVEVYLLAGLGMALFYPLVTFLSGLVGVPGAGAVALALVGGLLVVFLGLSAGWRRTCVRAGLFVAIFLGLFSLGMLTAWRGLLLSGGGLLVVGGLMVLYARRPVAPAAELPPAPVPAVAEESPRAPQPAQRHCPYCGRALSCDFAFCPACGHDTQRFQACPACGREQFVPADLERAHCTGCGQRLS